MNVYIVLDSYAKNVHSVYKKLDDAIDKAKKICTSFNYDNYDEIDKTKSYFEVCDFCAIEKSEVK